MFSCFSLIVRLKQPERSLKMEENIQIVQDSYNKFADGDVAGILANCSEDVAWETPEIENAPFSGKRRGHSGVGEFFAQLDASEEFSRFEPMEFIAQNNRVVVLGKSAVTVRETGNSYESDWVHIFKIEDGKITDFLEFFDNAAAARAHQKATNA